VILGVTNEHLDFRSPPNTRPKAGEVCRLYNIAEYLETMIERAETQVEEETEIIAAVREGLLM
jgi:hypothetical protein